MKAQVLCGLAMLGVVLAWALPLLHAARAQARRRIIVLTRRTVHLRGALPHLTQAALMPGGSYGVLSDRNSGDFVSLGIFNSDGALEKNLAGTSVHTGLATLTSLQADSRGILWVTTLMPARVARFSQNGLLSTSALPEPEFAYALALDEARGYVYVTGCAPQHPGVSSDCLLVHQFAVDGMKFRRSFLHTDPGILRNTQFSIQWVPADVDARGIVWAVDSPSFTLYSINPVSGNITSYLIRSLKARDPGALDVRRGGAYIQDFIRRLSRPSYVVATRHRVVVCIQRPSGEGHLLEVFNPKGAQIGEDVAAPGSLVGKGGNGGLLFGRSGKTGPVLIEGVLSDSR